MTNPLCFAKYPTTNYYYPYYLLLDVMKKITKRLMIKSWFLHSHLFIKYPKMINVQPTNTVIYARYSSLYKSIMPFNIAMKPKNQHIPITKLTYIYLNIFIPSQFSDYTTNTLGSYKYYNNKYDEDDIYGDAEHG